MTTRDFNFWEDQGAWPIDTPGFVFLARAVNEIGRAGFGGEWDRLWSDDWTTTPPANETEDEADLREDLEEEADAERERKFESVVREVSQACVADRLRHSHRLKRAISLGEHLLESPAACRCRDTSSSFPSSCHDARRGRC